MVRKFGQQMTQKPNHGLILYDDLYFKACAFSHVELEPETVEHV